MKNDKQFVRYNLIRELASLVSPSHFQKIILYVKDFSNVELKEVVLWYKRNN